MRGAALDLTGAPVDLAHARVVGAAGIAWPGAFEADLRRAVAALPHFATFADHHAYTAADVAGLERLLLQHRADALVVTAKDAVKLAPLWRAAPKLWILATQVLVEAGGETFSLHLKRLLSSRLGSLNSYLM